MSRHMLSYMSKISRTLFHLAVLCDSLRCGVCGTFCYAIPRNLIIPNQSVLTETAPDPTAG